MVQFDRREYFVVEEEFIILTFALSREAEQEVTVEVFTSDITAQGVNLSIVDFIEFIINNLTGFNDYTPLLEVLTFSTGETRISIPFSTLGEFELAELNETLRVSLSNPSDGLTLGEVSTATITIMDNDGT